MSKAIEPVELTSKVAREFTAGTFESRLLRSAGGGDPWARKLPEQIPEGKVVVGIVCGHDATLAWVCTEDDHLRLPAHAAREAGGNVGVKWCFVSKERLVELFPDLSL